MLVSCLFGKRAAKANVKPNSWQQWLKLITKTKLRSDFESTSSYMIEVARKQVNPISSRLKTNQDL